MAPCRIDLEGHATLESTESLNRQPFASANFSGPPRFVLAAANNLEIRQGSAAIDAGSDWPLPCVDNDCAMATTQLLT